MPKRLSTLTPNTIIDRDQRKGLTMPLGSIRFLALRAGLAAIEEDDLLLPFQQLSSIPPSGKPEALAHFAYYPVRQLEAEVLIDALNQEPRSTR